MSDPKTKLDNILFDYATTNRTDYRFGEIKEIVLTKYKEKPKCSRIRPPPLSNVHTLSPWKEEGIPFSLLHKPKDIIGTAPTTLQKPYEQSKDTGLEEAIKTRPRLVMTPAVSMDDIEDPRARAILCDDMYTSNMMRGSREAVAPFFNVKAPLPDLPAAANPITLQKLQPPMVSPEWRKETVSWDGKQLRSYCEPTADFWRRHKVQRCRPCDESAAVQAHRKIQHQLATRR